MTCHSCIIFDQSFRINIKKIWLPNELDKPCAYRGRFCPVSSPSTTFVQTHILNIQTVHEWFAYYMYALADKCIWTRELDWHVKCHGWGDILDMSWLLCAVEFSGLCSFWGLFFTLISPGKVGTKMGSTRKTKQSRLVFLERCHCITGAYFVHGVTPSRNC